MTKGFSLQLEWKTFLSEKRGGRELEVLPFTKGGLFYKNYDWFSIAHAYPRWLYLVTWYARRS